MDAVNDPAVETIVLMFASQTGKTSIEENAVGFHIDQDPAPILFVMPTLEMAGTFSKDRLAPLLRDTPVLSDAVGDPKSRDSDNSIRHKGFSGGHITLAGANSPASLASRPIRLLICDEIDRYPPSAGTEGDPVALAAKRTVTFWNRKIILSATPTIKTLSRIEAAFEESDQRRFFVPCPHCAHEQLLLWRNVRWPKGEPDAAAYCCSDVVVDEATKTEKEFGCGTLWTDVERWRSVSRGEWRAQAEFNGTAGFHVNELYSPWVELKATVNAFLEAKPHRERLKVWTNTALAETWEEQAEAIDATDIESRAEDWGEAPPSDVLVLTAGVDVQDDRLEVERVGWGSGEESWSVDHKIIYGDPAATQTWKDLDEYLLEATELADGRTLGIAAVCVDTGGHHTQAAYDYCKPRFNRGVRAIKGISRPGERRPVWPKRARTNNKAGVLLFMVGVDAAKDMVMARLRQDKPGPGYCHFPKSRDGEYFRQLTAEKVITEYRKGFPFRVYVKDPSVRNEALDLRVYAYAALVALNVNWGRLLQNTHSASTSDADPDVDSPALTPATSPPSDGAGRRRIGRSRMF